MCVVENFSWIAFRLLFICSCSLILDVTLIISSFESFENGNFCLENFKLKLSNRKSALHVEFQNPVQNTKWNHNFNFLQLTHDQSNPHLYYMTDSENNGEKLIQFYIQLLTFNLSFIGSSNKKLYWNWFYVYESGNVLSVSCIHYDL